MASAVKVIYDMSEDTRIREAARMREKSYNDMVNVLKSLETARQEGIAVGEARGIDIGRSEGLAVGEARGIEKGREMIINQLIDSGMTRAELDRILG